MPDIKISELPIQVRNLPVLGQKMWLRARNRAIRTNTESKAYSIAWDVIRQFFVKKNNKWVKLK